MTVHVLYENADWMPPLRRALEARGLPWVEHFTDGGQLDIGGAVPEGVVLNRMSPSSHTRGHQGGVQHVRELLGWLEAHGRRVINGSRAFEIELSKVKQGQKNPGQTMHDKVDDTTNIERALARARVSQITRLENLLPFLATLGSSAPFIGLFGTVWGIMDAFLSIAAAGQAELTLALMDALGIRTAALLGHSAGAPVALDAALVAPERVRSYIAVAPAVPPVVHQPLAAAETLRHAVERTPPPPRPAACRPSRARRRARRLRLRCRPADRAVHEPDHSAP